MDYREIVERARAIAERPSRPVNPQRLGHALAAFTARTPSSARLAERARELLPRGSEHTLPPSHPYPLYLSAGHGSRVRDVDGNEYVDYVLSGGAILLGHNHEGLNSKMRRLLEQRTNFHGFCDELELAAAGKIVQHIPSAERVRFTASGNEANAAAARIARAITGKKKVAKFMAGYHGWGDTFLTDMEVPGSGRFISQGVPAEVLDLTVVVPPNDLDALERAFVENERDGGIAAVFCEPVGGESGLVPFAEGFHAQAIEIAHRHGALYVFDEVVTGLRMGLGGAQAALGVTPDLTTLGKALTNGWPGSGAVCGRAEVMDAASTGLPDGRPYAYVAGTLSGNTLSAAAVLYTFEELERPGVLGNLFAAAQDYVDKLNALFSSTECGFFAYSFGGIIRVEMTAPHAVPLTTPAAFPEVIRRRSLLSEYSLVVIERGVLTRMGRDMISCSHAAEDNDRAVAAYGALVEALE